MTQLVIRDLEDDVRDMLVDMARRRGRSVEEEVRDILREAVSGKPDDRPNLGSRLAQCFATDNLDHEIKELRGHPVHAPSFES